MENKYIDNVVIVLDTTNYKTSYSEQVPFKAKVVQDYDHEILVESLVTKKQYELYYDQILEFMPIEDIKNIINLNKYGK